ncbi:MAG: DUF6323 family protein [Oscillospiraceae bacterium]|nr:DUF6323 family protein [Oscillospiraceae bacterium]
MDKNLILRQGFDSSLIAAGEDKKLVENLVALNAKANNYGLTITESIAREIAVYRNEALVENERFETNSDAIARLTSAFLQTRYIEQDDFAATMGEIINLFYLIKNEIEDELSDDELIREMLKVFTETCFGSVELMQSKGLEKILRKYNFFKDRKIWDDYENTNWEDYYDLQDESWRE